jgi:hypothetical protein
MYCLLGAHCWGKCWVENAGGNARSAHQLIHVEPPTSWHQKHTAPKTTAHTCILARNDGEIFLYEIFTKYTDVYEIMSSRMVVQQRASRFTPILGNNDLAYGSR